MANRKNVENYALIDIINIVKNLINGRRLEKILDEQRGSRPKEKSKKTKISKRKADELCVQW